MMSNTAKSFDILVTSLSVLHNNLDGPTKLFSNSAEFLDILANITLKIQTKLFSNLYIQEQFCTDHS